MKRIEKYGFICVLIGVLFCLAFNKKQSATEPYLIKYPSNWPRPVYDFNKNPLTVAGIELGRFLFYDPILSKDNTISCASCHLSFSAFTHTDHALSHGIQDSVGTRNSPALMNLAWNKSFMWDGAINHLDFQALAPIESTLEMGEDISTVVQKLQETERYPALFYTVFQDSIITGQHLLKALTQFQLTFISANSKYDKVMRNEPGISFSTQELNGYSIFKTHCSSCHTEPLFTSGEFANNGLAVDLELNDSGRFIVTKNPKDAFQFKIPTLRNIEFSYPYMHDGRFKKLNEVIDHYVSGISDSKTLHPALKRNIELTSNEKVDLLAFLFTLSDREFIRNPKFSYPKSTINQ